MEIDSLIEKANLLIDDIITSDKEKQCTNNKFTLLWCNSLVKIVAYYVSYIIEYSSYYNSYGKDMAVIYGMLKELLIKLSITLELACKGCLYVNIMLPVCRIYLETSINLAYLILNFKNKNELEQYRLRGLKHTLTYAETISINANNRGYMSEWEQGLLKSIKSEHDKIKVTASDIKKSKNKVIKDIFTSLNKGDAYNVAYKSLSTSVHSGWEYLSKFILDYDSQTDTFSIKENYKVQADLRLLNPLLLTTIEVLKDFLNHIPNHGIDMNILKDLDYIFDILCDIEIMHLNYLHNKPVLYNTKHIGKDNNI